MKKEKQYNYYMDAVKDNSDLCSLIAMEECSELIQAISKAKRGKLDKDNLTEEIADVLICIDWIKRIYDIKDNEIGSWLYTKKKRITERLNTGEFK